MADETQQDPQDFAPTDAEIEEISEDIEVAANIATAQTHDPHGIATITGVVFNEIRHLREQKKREAELDAMGPLPGFPHIFFSSDGSPEDIIQEGDEVQDGEKPQPAKVAELE